MSQAFDDAVHLAHAIQEGGPIAASLRAYEAKQIPRVREIMAAEMVSLPLHTQCKQEDGQLPYDSNVDSAAS